VHPVVATLAAAALAFAPPHHREVQQRAAARTTASPAAGTTRVSTLESQLLGQINGVRARRGLRPLRLSTGLTAAANQHSASMALKGYFSHNSANGTSFWKRIAGFYGYRGYDSWSVGENLLWSSPDVGATDALRMWMTSPEHRANLLNRDWREIGLVAVHAANAPGVYDGDEVTVVTADFGFRR
jgi:uncharacterized protein YkwD